MTAVNDITGDAIRSRATKTYYDNYDKVQFKGAEKSEMTTHNCPKMRVKINTVKGSECKYCGVRYD